MDRFIRAREVAQMVGLSQTTLWRLGKKGEFPLPLRITQGRKAWSERAVREWMDARAATVAALPVPLLRVDGIEAEIAAEARQRFALPPALQAKSNDLDDDERMAVRVLRRCAELDVREFNSRDLLRRMPAPKPSARDLDLACGVLIAAGALVPVLGREGASGRPRKDFRMVPIVLAA